MIVITATMVVPRGTSQSQPRTAPPAAPKFLIADSTGALSLPVRNATTGALVAKVTVPRGHPGANSLTYITGVTTSNGRDYLVAEYATSCQGAKPQPNYFGVTSIRTGHTTRWTAPSGNSVDTVSLTADGKQLCYNLQGEGPSSLIRVIPTDAAPGRAADLGRTVAEAPSGRWISFAAISADGSKVYFSTFTAPAGNPPWPMEGQIHVVNLVTGQSRLVYAPAGQSGLIASDPAVRYLLLQIQGKAERIVRLVRLDLTTGKATDLPVGKFRLPAILYW